MLPDLNENGDLPPGVHVADWAEIEQRFGKGTAARTSAFATLKRLHELASTTGSLRTFYVFGSFVSAALSKEFLRAWQLKRDGTLRGILEVG